MQQISSEHPQLYQYCGNNQSIMCVNSLSQANKLQQKLQLHHKNGSYFLPKFNFHNTKGFMQQRVSVGNQSKYTPAGHVQLCTEKSFRNVIKSNRNQIVFIIFRLIWNQTDVRLFPMFYIFLMNYSLIVQFYPSNNKERACLPPNSRCDS